MYATTKDINIMFVPELWDQLDNGDVVFSGGHWWAVRWLTSDKIRMMMVY